MSKPLVSALETPMMRQYLEIKARYPDAILFYRMGDFYEMFLDDAEVAAPVLDIALTTRDKNKPDPVPMCGVPVHAAEQHIRTLAERGYRVAICEQVEDAKEAGGKRLVRRDVVEVVTPGLVGDPAGLAGTAEVLLVALSLPDAATDEIGLALLDASTGDFRATCLAGAPQDQALPELVIEELQRVGPREILVEAGRLEADPRLPLLLRAAVPDAVVTGVEAASFEPASAPVAPDGFDGGDDADAARRAAAAVLTYLATNQPFALNHAPALRRYALRETMVVDDATRAHLELFVSSADGGRRNTLIDRLDRTCTAMGARKLARWVGYPLLDPAAIRERQDAVAHLAERDRARGRLRSALRDVRDLERMLARAVRPTAVPRDLGQLRASLEALPEVCGAFDANDDAMIEASELPAALILPETQPELASLLRDALIDEPPVIARGSRGANQTGYIREGYRPELDVLRESASKGREWIAGLEAKERERTGVSKLKVRFHPVHGYSFEITKSQLGRVPDDYERKQTLANSERFTTPELREIEGKVMGASERAAELERDVFESLRVAVEAEVVRVRRAAEAVAVLDALQSLAEVARQGAWVRPQVESHERLDITAGRHPVVEAVLSSQGSDQFVPNDCNLDTGAAQLVLLTGPNMSGKSTYLRQVALIVLLAQIGSFVPAEAATIGVVDRIFTRVGASDRLARGESTFMVEMRETAEILRQATRRSLIILDEIGRGTSTFDGLSIAWAVAEYLHDTPAVAARTLFATHYHELVALAETRARVRNAHFAAREWKDEVVFLRQLVPGGASRSYGIQVGKLAGLPADVVKRAREVLAHLEAPGEDASGLPRLAGVSAGRAAAHDEGQLSLALGMGAGDARERTVLDQLRAIDADRLTPIDALGLLHDWQTQLADAAGGGEGEAS